MNFTIAVQFLSLMVASFATALLALVAISRLDPPRIRFRGPFRKPAGDECVYLFDGSVLLDATDSARARLGAHQRGQSDWDMFLDSVSERFSELGDDTTFFGDGASISSDDGRLCLSVARNGAIVRIKLDEPAEVSTISRPHVVVAAERQELSTLRAVAGNTPCLIWRQDSGGEISWANGAYLKQAHHFADDPEIPTWPPVNLFPQSKMAFDTEPIGSTRLHLKLPGVSEPVWYDVFARGTGEQRVYTAIEVGAVVRAESTLAEFVQTLAKTFAGLKTGLAIFDKERRLTLFNPALSELTKLQPEFLAQRPTLQKVLNALRDKGMIPEPKDYQTWLQRIDKMEKASHGGTYQESWGLADGRTYRLSGQPHPDGAFAILLEDISSEVSLSRQYKYKLESHQSLFDSLDEAIVVFSPEGRHLMSNQAYARLWEGPDGLSPETTSLVEATRMWAKKSASSPVWGDLREFASTRQDRVEWYSSVRLTDGRSLSARVSPFPGGATLVGFRRDQGFVHQERPEFSQPVQRSADRIQEAAERPVAQDNTKVS